MHQLCQEHCSHFKRKTMQKTLGNNPHFSCFSASSKRKETTDAFGPASNLSKNTMSEGSSCKEPISSGTNQSPVCHHFTCPCRTKQLAIIFFHFVKKFPMLATISLNPQRLWALGNSLDFIITSPLKIQRKKQQQYFMTRVCHESKGELRRTRSWTKIQRNPKL